MYIYSRELWQWGGATFGCEPVVPFMGPKPCACKGKSHGSWFFTGPTHLFVIHQRKYQLDNCSLDPTFGIFVWSE